MSGPKHLWSGDWQHESATVSEELADRRAKPRDREPPISPAPRTLARRRAVPVLRRPGLRHWLPIVLAAALLLAAGAYGLTALLGSSGSPASTTAGGSLVAPAATPGRSPGPSAATPSGPSVSPAATTASPPSRPVSWLGMEIATLPPGAAVVETVRLGSEGELAGLEPGDVIVAINNRRITAAGDIGAAIQGLRAGDLVTLQISRGSTLFETEATLAAPPSVRP